MTIEELKLKIRWWESKRWIYNVVVGIFGILGVYDGLSRSEHYWTSADTFGIICWGIGANIFYSLGILLELFDWYYLKSKMKLEKFRLLFFIMGFLLSCFWTFYYGLMYFGEPSLW